MVAPTTRRRNSLHTFPVRHNHSSPMREGLARTTNTNTTTGLSRRPVSSAAATHTRLSPGRFRTTTLSPSPIRSRTYARISAHERNQGRVATANTRTTPTKLIAPRSRSNTRSCGRSVRDGPPVGDQYGDPVCDYDSNVTILYELLESSSWEKARGRCRSHPAEVRTWIVRKDNHKVRWKLLPLHASIIFQSPNFLVSALLDKFPAAISRTDDQGMLPLHLAFRHRQEDEDLLELLLAKYPGAAMIRDHRDRLPLEHGRDSKFSCKLMRKYTVAIVEGSRSMAGIADTSGGGSGGDSNTAQTSSLTASISGSERVRLEAEYESQLRALRVEYDREIHAMRQSHEEQAEMLRQKMNESAAEEKQIMVNQHNKEMNELRNLLINQDKERVEIVNLRKEVEKMRAEMGKEKLYAERITTEFGRVQASNKDLKTTLAQIKDEQYQIGELATRQQQELENARNMRNKLVHSLLRQEDNDDANEQLRGTKMIEMAEIVRERIEKIMEGLSSPRGEGDESLSREENLSLIEMDRRQDDMDEIEAVLREESPKLFSEDPKEERNAAFRANAPDFYTDDQKMDRDAEFHIECTQKVGNLNDDNFDKVHNLGDEISAMTENSNY